MFKNNSNILFKRRITVEQLNELTPYQKQKLRDWWNPENGDCFNWNDGTDVEVLHSYDGWSNEDLSYSSDPPHEFTEREKNESLPLLDIGQMIELIMPYVLINKGNGVELDQSGHWNIRITNLNRERGLSEPYYYLFTDNELCDALWKAVKEVLWRNYLLF